MPVKAFSPALKRSSPSSRPNQVYRPSRSKYPPAEVFRRIQLKHHPLPPPRAREPSPRTSRLLRRPWPHNLMRDNVATSHSVRYALALPLTDAQRFCHGRHAKWTELNSFMHAVECGICLCASDCTSDTAAIHMCEYCTLTICAECKAVHDLKGIRALMSRYSDGANTVEARKALVRKSHAF